MGKIFVSLKNSELIRRELVVLTENAIHEVLVSNIKLNSTDLFHFQFWTQNRMNQLVLLNQISIPIEAQDRKNLKLSTLDEIIFYFHYLNDEITILIFIQNYRFYHKYSQIFCVPSNVIMSYQEEVSNSVTQKNKTSPSYNNDFIIENKLSDDGFFLRQTVQQKNKHVTGLMLTLVISILLFFSALSFVGFEIFLNNQGVLFSFSTQDIYA